MMIQDLHKYKKLIKRIDDFHRKIDIGIIKLKNQVIIYMEQPLFDYLKDTKKEVDELYNETQLYVYSHYDSFNPKYMTDEEIMSRYAMSKLIDIKTRNLMEKTIEMLQLESDHYNEIIKRMSCTSYC